MNEIERTLVERAGGLHYCWLHFFAPDFQSLLKVLQRSPKFWNFYLSFFFKLLSTWRYKLNVMAESSSTALSLLLFPNTETFLPSYKKDKLAISTFKCLLKLHTEMGTHNQILFFWVGLFRKFLFVVFLDTKDNFSTPGLFQNNW